MAENGLETVTDCPELSRGVIESMEEACDFIDEAYDRNISLDGCESLEDMKERFLAHLFPSPSVAELKLEHIERENRERRNDVAKFVEQTLSVIQPVKDLVNRLLSQEEITNDVESDLTEILRQVTKQECYILVSGETNAGKSTLLNLLLGEEILPNSILSCTATITKIRYAPHYRVEIRRDGGLESASFNDATRTLEFLDKLNDPDNRPVFRKDAAKNVVDVDLFCPAPILRSGVVLVDTPGVGEDDQMDEVVGRFVTGNRIAGFIYVIMSDHEGGVQEDRLIKLMKMIIKKQSEEKKERILKRTQFNPKSAIFVCNRWDLIPEKSEDLVKKHTFSRLEKCWPEFEESQVYFFSTKRSLMHLEVDVQYVTREYSKLLQGLKTLFSKALNSVVSRCHRWLEYFLQRALYHIRTIVKRHNMSEKKLEIQFSKAKGSFDELRRQSDDNIRCLRRTILQEEAKILKELKVYLVSQEVAEKLSKWNRSTLPNTGPKSRNWKDFKKDLDDIVWDRLGDILDEHERDSKIFQNAVDTLVREANTRFSVLEGQLKILENEMSDSASESGQDENRPTRRKSILYPQLMNDSIINQRNEMAAPTRLPIKILSVFSKHIASKLEKIATSTKISQYERHPERILSERSSKIIKSIIKSSDEGDKDANELRQIISGYLSKPYFYLEALERSIPNMIASNMSLMEEVKEKTKINEEEKRSYEAIFTSLVKVRDMVLDHGFSYYPPKELTYDDIVLEIDIDKTFQSNSSRSSGGGIFTEIPKTRDATTLWTVFRQGYFHQEDRKIDFTVRTYLPSVRPEHMYEEVQRIRFLNHQNVAEFIGTLKTSTLPAYIFAEHVVTSRRYLKRHTTPVVTFIPVFIGQVANGLEYLHAKRLTHMELTLDSIMINNDGTVKLCGGCLPRTANLPMEKTLVDAASFVYLSPEVLNGETYGLKADVYSFALIVIETYTSSTAFRKEKQWKLSEFSANVDPRRMIDLKRFHYLPEASTDLLSKCLDPNPGTRATINDCKQLVESLNSTRPLFRRTSACVMRKVPSSEDKSDLPPYKLSGSPVQNNNC